MAQRYEDNHHKRAQRDSGRHKQNYKMYAAKFFALLISFRDTSAISRQKSILYYTHASPNVHPGIRLVSSERNRPPAVPLLSNRQLYNTD